MNPLVVAHWLSLPGRPDGEVTDPAALREAAGAGTRPDPHAWWRRQIPTDLDDDDHEGWRPVT